MSCAPVRLMVHEEHIVIREDGPLQMRISFSKIMFIVYERCHLLPSMPSNELLFDRHTVG